MFTISRNAATATAAAAIAAMMAMPAMAGTINVSKAGSNIWGIYGHRVANPSNLGSNVYAGTFALNSPGMGGDFLAWCLDLNDELTLPSSYETTTSPFDYHDISAKVADIQSLFDTSYSGLDMTDNDTSAAWQQALWEIVYEDSGTYDVASGNFTVTTNGTANGFANGYLAALTGSTTGSYDLTFLDGGKDNQDLVTVSAVPLPASGLMLIGALAGLGLLGATRRRAAVAA